MKRGARGRMNKREGKLQGKRSPERVDDVLASVLERAGLADRIVQAEVFPEWPEIVGAHIAAATEPIMLQQDGTLVIAVKTHAWMQELSLMEPDLLRSVNHDKSRAPILRLRWLLRR